MFSWLNHVQWKKISSVLFLGLLISAFCYFFVDIPMADYWHTYLTETYRPFFSTLTQIGGYKFAFLVLVSATLLMILLKQHKIKIRCYWLFFAVFASTLMAGILKFLLGRARPELLFSEGKFGFFGISFDEPYWSMPSGHTTTIMSFACALALIMPRRAWLCYVLGFLISCTRILLTKHYVSDVLVSTVLAYTLVNVLFYWMRSLSYFHALSEGKKTSG